MVVAVAEDVEAASAAAIAAGDSFHLVKQKTRHSEAGFLLVLLFKCFVDSGLYNIKRLGTWDKYWVLPSHH